MIIGILGGIGAGKSTVVRMLEQLGALSVDADTLAHDALELPAVRSALATWLGVAVFDVSGSVDRRALAKEVFGDPGRLKKLESLVHPHVRERINEKLNDFRRQRELGSRRDENFLVLDVSLLASSPLRAACDALVFVHADLDVRQQRVKRSRGWCADELEKRERHQTPVEEKRRMADYVIDNSQDEDSTWRRVEKCLEELRKRANTRVSGHAGGRGEVRGGQKA